MKSYFHTSSWNFVCLVIYCIRFYLCIYIFYIFIFLIFQSSWSILYLINKILILFYLIKDINIQYYPLLSRFRLKNIFTRRYLAQKYFSDTKIRWWTINPFNSPPTSREATKRMVFVCGELAGPLNAMANYT